MPKPKHENNRSFIYVLVGIDLVSIATICHMLDINFVYYFLFIYIVLLLKYGFSMHRLKDLTILCDVSLLNFVEGGMVYIFYGGSNFPKGNATFSSKCTLTKPCPKKIVSIFSDSITKRNTTTT